MVIVLFEVTMKPGKDAGYFDLASQLRPELEKVDGFISVERFESLARKGKYLSMSIWRDADAVRAWRDNTDHQAAQRRGKDEVFADYRIRVTEVVREYGAGHGLLDAAAVPPEAQAAGE